MKCGTARRMTISPSRVSISRRSPLLSPVGDLARDSNGQVFPHLPTGTREAADPRPSAEERYGSCEAMSTRSRRRPQRLGACCCGPSPPMSKLQKPATDSEQSAATPQQAILWKLVDPRVAEILRPQTAAGARPDAADLLCDRRIRQMNRLSWLCRRTGSNRPPNCRPRGGLRGE